MSITLDYGLRTRSVAGKFTETTVAGAEGRMIVAGCFQVKVEPLRGTE